MDYDCVCICAQALEFIWESLAVFWTLWVIPHCVSVSHLARWMAATPYSFPLYTSITSFLSRDRQIEKDILSLQEIKRKGFSLVFTTWSQGCLTNLTDRDSKMSLKKWLNADELGWKENKFPKCTWNKCIYIARFIFGGTNRAFKTKTLRNFRKSVCLAAFNNEALMLLLLIRVTGRLWGPLRGTKTLQMEFQTSSVNYHICRCVRSVCQKEVSFRNAVKWTAAMRL